MTFFISFSLLFPSSLPTRNIPFPIFPPSNNTIRVFPLLLIHQSHSSYTNHAHLHFPPYNVCYNVTSFNSVNDMQSRITISFASILACNLWPSHKDNQYWIASSWWQKRHVRNILFGAPSVRTSRSPYDNLGRDCISRKRSSYLATISCIRCIMFCSRNTTTI